MTDRVADAPACPAIGPKGGQCDLKPGHRGSHAALSTRESWPNDADASSNRVRHGWNPAKSVYEPCVLDSDGNCTRWSHDHSEPDAIPNSAADREEAEMLKLIDERDRAERYADELAAALAPPDVLGEHSSGNNPWQNALDHAGHATRNRAAELADLLRPALNEWTDEHGNKFQRFSAGNRDTAAAMADYILRNWTAM